MSVDLIHLWGTMGWFAKGVVIIMAFMSIWSLTVMIQKFFQFQRSQAETRKFAPQFSRAIQEENLDQAISLAEKNKKSHVSRVLGEALAERGILPGDVLIADTSAPPTHGRVAIVMLHGEVWVAQLAFRRGQWWMRPGSADRPLVALDGDGTEIWAVVAALVRPRV